jgi:hypothetical protein
LSLGVKAEFTCVPPESKGKTMKDNLDKYISRRKKRDAKFAEHFDSGYQQLKVGVLLRHARESSGITQEDLGAAPAPPSPPSRGWRIMPKTCASPPSNASRTLWAKASSFNW